MNDDAIPDTVDRQEIDERGLREWMEYGFREMALFLARRNNFRTYCEMDGLD
jgi:hypothetical protein